MSANEKLALHIVQQLRAHSYTALLVGGCVRDRLLGVEPKDYDVSTDARPETVVQLFPKSQTVGAHFGVVMVTDEQGGRVEVATFRSEGHYADGRRPDSVTFETNPARDAERRDFTINALMQDPVTGEVFDWTGGRQDLADRVVRAVGDPARRFQEDHLRMLRAVRFAARLAFSIEENTMSAIRASAANICRIAVERVREELVRILTEGGAGRGMQLLDQSGLLAYVLPEVKALQGVAQPPEFHPEGDVWTHVMVMLAAMGKPSATLAWGVLLHDVGKPPTFRVAERIRFDGHAEKGADMAREILLRLRFSNEDCEQVVSLVANHMRFKDVLHMRPSTLKRFLCLPRFSEHLELHRLDCLASNGYTESYEFVKRKLSEFAEEELRPAKLLTGKDLIAAGFAPGPDFSRALEAVETAQLENEIHTREQALEVARLVLEPAAP